MPVVSSLENDVFIWNYKKLYAAVLFGLLESTLENLREACSERHLDFAPVREERGRDFLAAFCFRPVADITLVRGLLGDTSIVVYSLDKEKSSKLIKKLAERSSLRVYSPQLEHVQNVKDSFMLETDIYRSAEFLSNRLGVSIEAAFGVIHYESYLEQYKKLPEREAMLKAYEKFGLKGPTLFFENRHNFQK